LYFWLATWLIMDFNSLSFKVVRPPNLIDNGIEGVPDRRSDVIFGTRDRQFRIRVLDGGHSYRQRVMIGPLDGSNFWDL
jgi:hypothetical protein